MGSGFFVLFFMACFMCFLSFLYVPGFGSVIVAWLGFWFNCACMFLRMRVGCCIFNAVCYDVGQVGVFYWLVVLAGW